MRMRFDGVVGVFGEEGSSRLHGAGDPLAFGDLE